MPSPPAFGDTDYQGAMLRLSPRGRIWRTDTASIFGRVLLALAPTYTRSTAAAAQLLVDANPSTTVNLLPEWEQSLGLPDPCSPPNPTVPQRQAAVRAKWGSRGGQSAAFYTTLSAALGYNVTITSLAPSRFGRSFGQPFGGLPWAFAWTIAAASGSMDAVLECEITHASPAHTVPIFDL